MQHKKQNYIFYSFTEIIHTNKEIVVKKRSLFTFFHFLIIILLGLSNVHIDKEINHFEIYISLFFKQV